MDLRKKSLLVAACLCLGLTGCAGVSSSKYSYSNSFKANEPVKAEGCYDAAILLRKSFSDSTAIAKKVLVALDSTISAETENQIMAQRNRHIGLFIGSGGEELFLTLKPVSDSETFVTAATKTGLVGGAGQKAWSCQIVDQIAAMASR